MNTALSCMTVGLPASILRSALGAARSCLSQKRSRTPAIDTATASALSFEDPRWPELKAGYRAPVDLRPLLRALEFGSDLGTVWLNELHLERSDGDAVLGVSAPLRAHRRHGRIGP